MLRLHGLDTTLRGLPDVDVVAHIDSTPMTSEKMTHTGARRHYATLADMLADEPPDIVVLTRAIPTTISSRFRRWRRPAAISTAAAGCRFAGSRRDDRIVEGAVKLCMAHRAGPTVRTMKAMVEAGDRHAGDSLRRGKCDHRGGERT